MKVHAVAPGRGVSLGPRLGSRWVGSGGKQDENEEADAIYHTGNCRPLH